jgi:hypothetical protein
MGDEIVACSRKLLGERWEWFRDQLEGLKHSTEGILSTPATRIDDPTTHSADLTATNNLKQQSRHERNDYSTLILPPKLNLQRPVRLLLIVSICESSLDCHLSCNLHTLSLSTPPTIFTDLTALLAFATMYEENQLRTLCVHWLLNGWNEQSGISFRNDWMLLPRVER